MKNVCILMLIAICGMSLSAATVGYWEFDGTDAIIGKDAVGTHDLVTAIGTVGSSGLKINPIPNPDGTTPWAGQGDNSAGNTSATWFTSGDVLYSPNNSDSSLHDSTFDLDPTKSFTVEGWFRPLASGVIVGNQHAAGDPDVGQLGNNFKGWRVNTLDGGNTLQFHADGYAGSGSSISLQTPCVYDDLNFFAVVFDVANDSIRLYLEDELKDSTSIPDNWSFHRGGALAFGARDLGDGTFSSLRYAGAIDEIRYSDEALSPSQFLVAPEPATMALLSMGLIGLLRRRK